MRSRCSISSTHIAQSNERLSTTYFPCIGCCGRADGAAVARNIEDENLISTLYEQINKLEAQNSELSKKNKKITDILEKRKKQVATLERQVNEFKRRDVQRPGARRPKGFPEVDVVPARTSIPHDQGQQSVDQSFGHTNMAEVAKSLKNR